VLLEILRTLECLTTEVTFVGLQGYMDSNVGGNVVTLHCSGAARVPTTSQVQVVGAFATNMLFTNMLLQRISCYSGRV